MKKSNSRRLKQILIFICCTILLISSSFAMFFKDYDYSLLANGGETSLVSSWTFTSGVQNGFTNPGDVCYGNLAIQNSGTAPITYELKFSVSNNSGLENATLLYIDNELIGNLGWLINNSQTTYKLPSYSLNTNEAISHQIKLEYHIGASAYYQNKNFTLAISCYAKQILNTDGITFVKSWNELKQIANQQNKGKNSGEMIKLANDITPSVSDSDITFNLPTTLDLNGKTLTLSKSIYFKGAEKSFVKNSGTTGGLSGAGKLYMDKVGGLLVTETALNSYIQIVSFSDALLEETLTNAMKEKLKAGILVNTEVLGSFAVYSGSLSLSLDGSPILDGIIPVQRGNSTVVKQLLLTVNARASISLEFQVIGKDDSSILTAILAGPLSYINNLNEISYDIFLPFKLKEYNCHLSWWSSNSNLLSDIGIYTKPVSSTPVKLIATITFNEHTYIKEFDLIASGQSNDDKLTFLCGQFGDILFSVLNQTENLPTAGTYKNWTNNADLGITNIAYSYDSSYSFLNLVNNSSLSITASTTTVYVPLTITATFAGGTPSTISKIIDITISLAGGEDVGPIYNNVVNNLPKNDTSANFTLPTTFNNVTINYYLPDNIAGNKLSSDMIDSTTEVVNSQDAVNIVSLSTNGSGTTVVLDNSKIPPKTTLVYLIAEVVGNGSSSRRQVSFVVDGVLHGGATYNVQYQIPDPNLFSALKTMIGIPSGQGYIALKDIQNATYSSLTKRTSTIQSVKGLEYFTKLTTLDLGGSAAVRNTISDITPLASLVNLTYVDLSYSSITDISPIKYCTATPSGGITLYFGYNTNLIDNSPIANLYVGKADFTGTSCTYNLGAYTIFKVMMRVYGTISNAYNTYYKLAEGTNLIQSGSSKEVNAFPLADSFFLPTEMYDTFVLPTGHTKTTNISYSWSVYSGMGSQYMTIANPTAAATVSITSRPVNDTTVVIVLNIAAHSNLSSFGIPRAFFMTLKGTG